MLTKSFIGYSKKSYKCRHTHESFWILHDVHNFVVAVVAIKMALEFGVPSFHSIYLVFVESLTRAVTNVSNCPFFESSCDLSNTNNWIFTVISVT